MNNLKNHTKHRTYIVLFATMMAIASAKAQVAQWILHPKYASITMLGNSFYLVSNNGKLGILNSEEKEVVPLKYEKMSPFYSHAALLYNDGRYVGYVSDQGRVTEFAPSQYDIIGEPRFYEGFILVRDHKGYYYLQASNDSKLGPFAGGHPFSEGYAVVNVPKSLKKIFEGDYTIRLLSAQTGELVNLNLDEYDIDDIDFISSVCNGKSIMILKKRFYEYNLKTNILTPIHFDGNSANKKSRIMANERPVNLLKTDSGYEITFKQGKMTFDSLLRLKSINYFDQQAQKNDIPEEQVAEKTSPIKAISYQGTELLGLAYNGKEVLSPQFEKVASLWNNEALVVKNGKYGIVTINPKYNYRYVLNDNMPIGFEHQTASTNIKAVCPPYLKTSLMSLSSEDPNLHINGDTRKENTNVETAVLTYLCTLDIPDDIGLEKTSATTKLSLNYDGLKMMPHSIPFDTWYINNYAVSVLKHSIDGAILTAEISVQNNQQTGKNYFRNVTIEAEDSVNCDIRKVTEELYSARFFGWKDGTLRFSIDITEDGCPTLSYPRSISVSKAKKAEKPEIEAPSTSQARIKRKVVKSKPVQEKKIITHF